MRYKQFHRKHFVAILLIIALLIGTTSFIFSQPAVGADEDALSAYQQEKRDLQAKMKAQQAKVRAADASLKTFQGQLSNLEAQIAEAEGDLASLDKNLVAADVQLQVANSELNKTQNKLDARTGALKTRLRDSYMYGQMTMVDVLVDSGTMEEFITQSYYLEKILAYDMDLVDSIEDTLSELEVKKANIQKKKSNIEQLIAAQNEAKLQLESQQKEKATLVAAAENDKETAEKAYAEMEALSKELTSRIKTLQAALGYGQGTGVLGWPLPGRTYISSYFGPRTHPLTKKKSTHTGIDIPAPTGTAIKASDSGKVLLAEWLGAYGNAIIIDHGGNISTMYGHLSAIGVSVGQDVNKGDTIGKVGSTGWSTGAHLHFEVRINGTPKNPLKYVSPD